MKFKLTIFYLFLFSSISLFAQKAKITGVVTDENGNPIELVVITEKNTINATMTTEQGKFTLSVAPKDSVTIVFSAIGYNTTQRVIPNLTGDIILNVSMKFRSIELGGVEIKATQIRTNTVQSLDPGTVRLLADPGGGNIESILVTQAGFSGASELSSQYSARGGGYDENIIYINGIEVYRPLLIRSGQQEGLSSINADMTAKIDYSLGGYEPRYGDKMSSVLDITYKKPTEFEGAVSASFLGGTAYIGNTVGKFSQITGFRYKRGTSLLKTLDTSGDYDPTFLDLQTYMTYDFSKKLSLSFLGNISQNNYNFVPQTRETAFGGLDGKILTVYFDGQERDAFHTFFGAGILKYALTENTNLGLQVSGFQSIEEETYDFSGEYWLSNIMGEDKEKSEKEVIGVGRFQEHARNHLHSDVFNISHIGSHRINSSNNLQWALGYQREVISDRVREYEIRDSMGYSLPYNNETVNVYRSLYSDNDISSNRISGYFQDTYKFRTTQGLFSITAGIRGSYWDFNNEFILSPRASIGFVPTRNQNYTFRFATGVYYQAPFYKEFRKTEIDEHGNSIIVLNKNIKSQRSIHLVLGGDYAFQVQNRPFKFTAETFYKKLDDLVPYTVDDVKIRYYGYNCASGYITGLDMKLSGEFVQGTDSWLSVSLMKSQQDINGVKVPLPTDRRYNISLYFTDHLPKNDRLQMNFKLVCSDGLPFAKPNLGYESGYFRSRAYLRVDMGLSYLLLRETDIAHDRKLARYFKNIWIGVDCFNFIDHKNVNSYYWVSDVTGAQYPVPNFLTGRQLNVRLVAEF
ncbi:MAG: TonB-dependent receptor [Dysgonamonadaceae bacterium]|jgi:hypothetical protein|nr:TonB-dependent receptor [Dysgonamonadaceae bacterium]